MRIPRFEEATEESVQAVSEEMRAKRGGRALFIRVCDLAPPLTRLSGDTPQADFNEDLRLVIDAFVRTCGLQGLGESWIEIDEGTARWILSRVLFRGLAHSAELMGESEAGSLARLFVRACFPELEIGPTAERYRYYTNGQVVDGPTMFDLSGRPIDGWTPATDATFDAGVVLDSRRRIGVLWASDED